MGLGLGLGLGLRLRWDKVVGRGVGEGRVWRGV